MTVIIGFDDAASEFITNDPGTRYGNGCRYKYQVIMNAIINYGTRRNTPLVDNRKVMIVVEK